MTTSFGAIGTVSSGKLAYLKTKTLTHNPEYHGLVMLEPWDLNELLEEIQALRLQCQILSAQNIELELKHQRALDTLQRVNEALTK